MIFPIPSSFWPAILAQMEIKKIFTTSLMIQPSSILSDIISSNYCVSVSPNQYANDLLPPPWTLYFCQQVISPIYYFCFLSIKLLQTELIPNQNVMVAIWFFLKICMYIQQNIFVIWPSERYCMCQPQSTDTAALNSLFSLKTENADFEKIIR